MISLIKYDKAKANCRTNLNSKNISKKKIFVKAEQNQPEFSLDINELEITSPKKPDTDTMFKARPFIADKNLT